MIPGRGPGVHALQGYAVRPHSALATFQRLLDTILEPELEPRVLIYLDDIIVTSTTFEEHLELLAEVFRRLREAKLQPNSEKCHFCRKQLRYLGHIINQYEIRTDPEKDKAVAEWPTPTSLKKIRQFLGVAS